MLFQSLFIALAFALKSSDSSAALTHPLARVKDLVLMIYSLNFFLFPAKEIAFAFAIKLLIVADATINLSY